MAVNSAMTSWGGFPHDSAASVITASSALAAPPEAPWLPRGAGRSYGDVCLNADGTLVTTEDLNAIVSFDERTGRLIAQAGCTFAQLYQRVMPAGWQMPVVPGTRFLTLGGAIANDIHGKNHHVSGTIGRYVQALALWRSDGSVTRCSASEHSDLFHATIGGLGLTGLILEVEIQLVRLESTTIRTRTTKTHSLMDTMDVLRQADRVWVHSVAWVDALCEESYVGRGQVLVGREADRSRGVKPPSTRAGMRWLPVLGRPALQPSLIRTANRLKWSSQGARESRTTMEFGPFFHPLDRIHRWDGVYGPSGFLQYQFVVPDPAGYEVMVRVLRTLRRAHMPVYLAVLKRFGDLVSPGWMSFPMEGWTLALDIPIISGREPEVLREQCDPVVREAGGRIYPAKDASMAADTFRQTYTRWTDVERLRDPSISSSFWRRVTTTP